MHSTIFARLRKGDALKAKYAIGLVGYLLTRDTRTKSRIEFLEYLADKGVRNPEKKSYEEIVSHLWERTEASKTTDVFTMGDDGFSVAARDVESITESVQACSDPQDVRCAIEWMYVNLGRQLNGYRSFAVLDATEAAKEAIGLSREHYEKQAISWSDFDRWTVVYARRRGVPMGMSIVLPLRLNAYDAVRAGKRKTYDIQPSDLMRPSRNLLVEALALSPEYVPANNEDPYRSILNAMVCQQGLLARCDDKTLKEPLRLLTHAGNPANRKRAEDFGYKETGTCLAGSHLGLLERVISLPPRGKDYIFWATLRGIGEFADELLGPQPIE
jgi:hypothetical protein